MGRGVLGNTGGVAGWRDPEVAPAGLDKNLEL